MDTDTDSDQLLRLREAKLLEWIFLGPDALNCTKTGLDMIQGFARRLLMMQTSRGEILHILSPERQRKLSIAEFAHVNVYVNAFYLQMVKSLENLTRVLQIEFSVVELTDPQGCDGGVYGEWSDTIFQLNVADLVPGLATSLEPMAIWLGEIREARNPCILSNPLYIHPAAAEGDELDILRGLEAEVEIAAQTGNFHEYRQKISQAQQLGSYFPLLANRGPDTIQLWPLPAQVLDDAQSLLNFAEPVFLAVQQRAV